MEEPIDGAYYVFLVDKNKWSEGVFNFYNFKLLMKIDKYTSLAVVYPDGHVHMLRDAEYKGQWI